MNEKPLMPSSEIIVRALYPPLWDERVNAISLRAFEGQDVSVSRVAILPESEIVQIYKRQFPAIEATCSIGMEVVENILLNPDTYLPMDSKKQNIPPKLIGSLIDKPEPENTAHAEIHTIDYKTAIPRGISKGMSTIIISNIQMISPI